MSNFEELTREDGLYDIEGGGLALDIAGFVLAVILGGYTVYEAAKSSAADAGKRDAYNDMYLSK